MTGTTVWAIPLATKGFIPVDPETNPVLWYLEDCATGRLVRQTGCRTKEEAERYGELLGFTVTGKADPRAEVHP